MKVITVAWTLEPESVASEPASSGLFSICGKASQPQPSDKYPKLPPPPTPSGHRLGSESRGQRCSKRETKF